jgi:hypothetical protein
MIFNNSKLRICIQCTYKHPLISENKITQLYEIKIRIE